jgi:hypothetical protein
MPDTGLDDGLIAGAIAEYREVTMPYVRPAGAAAALATAARRRNRRAAALVAAAVVAVVASGATLAALRANERAAPSIIGGSASATPSAAGPSATPSAPVATGPQGPDDLRDATLILPAELPSPACPRGPTKFSNGESGVMKIEKVLSADVDRDGAADDVALIGCRPGEGSLGQIVAFHRRDDGTFSTIGLVVAVGGTIENVTDVAVSGSEVLARVGDHATRYTDNMRATGVFQWRTYGWDGAKFVQTKGSTSFQADTSSNHLTTTVSTLVFDKPQGGTRHGAMTVTVHNTGNREVTQLELVMVMPDRPVLSSPACTTDVTTQICRLGTLAAGASKSVVFGTTMSVADADAAIAGGGLDLSQADAQLRIGDQRYSDTRGVTVTFR